MLLDLDTDVLRLLEEAVKQDHVCEHAEHKVRLGEAHLDDGNLWYVFVHSHCLEPRVAIFCGRYVNLILSNPTLQIHCPKCPAIRPPGSVYTVLEPVDG